MVFVPPRHYVIVENPVARNADNEIELNEYGQPKLRLGVQEVRQAQDPFPLYDGEVLAVGVTALEVISENSALVLRAKRSFFDKYGKRDRAAGERWLFKGPDTYYPQVEVDVEKTQSAVILYPDEALHLKALYDCRDYQGTKRRVGEKWFVTGRGAYLPSLQETVIGTVKAHVLTHTTALHVTATWNCIDAQGKPRMAGEQWLVTKEDARTYLPGPLEKVKRTVNLTVLSPTQFCIVQDPVDPATGLPNLGTTQLRKGPATFFLLPGEALTSAGVTESTLLSPSDGLLVEATRSTKDEEGNVRKAGEEWYIWGPTSYCTPAEVQVRQRLTAAIALETSGYYFFRTGPIFVIWLLIIFRWFLSTLAGWWAGASG